MTSIITAASAQWASRPADERFTSLPALYDRVEGARRRSVTSTVSSRKIALMPDVHNEVKGLKVDVGDGRVPNGLDLTHWSFGQLAGLAKGPAGYLRQLPAPLAADCVNYGMRFSRDVEDVGVLVTQDPERSSIELRAATGPKYGRVWNADIVKALIDRFGDGVTGDWRVPGEFGRAVTVDKDNTTIYGSDRDMFVFLADEENRIEVPARRNGEPGSLARGFYVWNSEVGARSLGIAMFLFDYVCMNRMIWGVTEHREIRIRHTSGAPDRWLEEVQPILEEYRHSSPQPIEDMIASARQKKVGDDLSAFLQTRFGSKAMADKIEAAHMIEEGRPIETLWDVTVGATAFAKTIEHQDARVEVERDAGKVLALAA